MKTFICVLLLNLISLNLTFCQNADSNYKKIETGNWLDLSYKALNENGEVLPFSCVEQLPEFPGGYDALAKFIKDTLIYPITAREDSICGLVKTIFVIDENGKVTNISNLKSIRYDLDSACIRAVSKFPDWTKPKYATYKNIRIQFMLPINFIITK